MTVTAPADTTAPTLDLPSNITTEATSASGAVVTFTATADDADPAHPAVACTPSSGSTFALGTTTVSCSATDAAGNTGNGSFTVTVQDTTAPKLTLPSDITKEATGPTGAVASWTASASDLVDGSVAVTCDANSGDTFALGSIKVSCSATDAHGNKATDSFTVTVQDTTPPALTLPSDITKEATGPTGAVASWTASASDLVDGSVAVACDASSGDTFALGSIKVSCSATDAAGNKAAGTFTVTVQDTTPPALTLPSDITKEATGPTGAVASWTASASDLVDGSVAVACDANSGDTFALGSIKVSCSATDAAGNTANGSFTVTVQDTTPPALSLPSDMTVEATGSTGAVATWTASASDLVDGSVAVACDASSGGTFPLGPTKVSCSATDAHGNTATGSFTVTVQDTTPPALSLPSDMTAEATGPSGAAVTYSASATDLVDGSDSVTCAPASGSTFALGATTVSCSATDAAGNKAAGSFTVTVQDTTAPALKLPSDITKEATGSTGAVATWTASASDLVDGSVAVTCDANSGDTFALGSTKVSCSATDAHGNKATESFTVTVQDTTPPSLKLPSDITKEATGSTGAVATWTASASDLVDGSVALTCDASSGDTFPLGSTKVSCSATDAHGNKATGSFTVTVQDTTPPALTLPSNVVTTATSSAGRVVTFTASATDLVDGSITPACTRVSGSTFAPGTTTVNCSATDSHGNKATGSFTVAVSFNFIGFLQPVDNKVLNGMKGGSTAPIKWQIGDGSGGFISDLSVVKSEQSGTIACNASAITDTLEETATGGTTLRYDFTNNQFVYNWQSPKQPGTCFDVRITLIDGSQHDALFTLK